MDVDLTIIIQLTLFVVLVTVLNRFVFRHFLRVMDQRHEKTQTALDEADRLERETVADQDAYQTRMREAQAAAQREREALRGKGRDEQRRLVNEARTSATEALGRARDELEQAEQQAESALGKSAAELAELLVRKVVGPTLLLAITLVGSSSLAAGGEHGGHGALHVNWWAWSMDAPPVGWFLLDFVLFVWVIVHYTRRPIVKAFAERHERIKRIIGQAQERFGRARATFDEYRGKLAHVEDEMAGLVERGRENGEAERRQIVAAGAEFAERLRHDAETVAGQEIERAQARLRIQTARQALILAEQKLRGVLSPDEQQRLIEQAIVELESDVSSSMGARP
ncbi:MAG: hypothetical protein AAB426_10545 [Myxococcota bacterium]